MPEPVGPVNTVNSPRLKPLRMVLNQGKKVLFIPLFTSRLRMRSLTCSRMSPNLICVTAAYDVLGEQRTGFLDALLDDFRAPSQRVIRIFDCGHLRLLSASEFTM